MLICSEVTSQNSVEITPSGSAVLTQWITQSLTQAASVGKADVKNLLQCCWRQAAVSSDTLLLAE